MPLKIVIADPHSNGGGQVTYVSSLARQLTQQGHEVIIACRPGSVLAEAAGQIGCRCENTFLFKGGARLLGWAQDLATMRGLLRTTQPHILHVNGSQDHWTGALANRLSGSRACVVRTRHNTYSVKRSLSNRLLNRRWTNFQIVVCDVVRKDLAKHPAFDARRMTTIHNGVDVQLFQRNAARRAEARAEFGYTDEHMVIGIAARLVQAKGHVHLFKALAQIREQYPHARLLVLGQGNLEAELKALAAQLKIADQVLFAGFRNDMDFCVHAMDIGAQPSVDCDTSSFSLKEEMACEIPVVTSNYGGLREIVTDGVEGFVVPVGTVPPLGSALRRLMDAESLRHKMGTAGRRRVLQEFSLEVFAERTVRAYEKALQYHREYTAS